MNLQRVGSPGRELCTCDMWRETTGYYWANLQHGQDGVAILVGVMRSAQIWVHLEGKWNGFPDALDLNREKRDKGWLQYLAEQLRFGESQVSSLGGLMWRGLEPCLPSHDGLCHCKQWVRVNYTSFKLLFVKYVVSEKKNWLQWLWYFF